MFSDVYENTAMGSGALLSLSSPSAGGSLASAFNGPKNGVATVTKSNGVSTVQKEATWGTAAIFQTSGLILYFGH